MIIYENYQFTSVTFVTKIVILNLISMWCERLIQWHTGITDGIPKEIQVGTAYVIVL